MADTYITLKGGWCSGALGGVGPLPLQHPGLLAACRGAGLVTVSNIQTQVVLVLAEFVLDAA